MRMFAALVPPPEAIEDLAGFLAPRTEAEPGFRWTDTPQWHVTLSFMPDVQERHVDDLLERLRRAGARRTPFEVGVAGGGAFPNPRRSKVLYAALEVSDPVELGRLATGVRAAGNKAGADVRGGPFRPHVTLARLKQPVDVTRWLTVLGAYSGPRWQAAEVTLIESHLGEGPRRRPRYEVVDTFPLGATGRRVGS